jgi:(p)ppGpp synthase/HD superfamily hydrolase
MEKIDFEKCLSRMAPVESDFRDRAGKIHRDVNQFYEFKPYSYHLCQVAACVTGYLPLVVSDEKDILPVLFAAYFHDSIEDARLTYNDVRRIASEYMDNEQAFLAAEIVYALTNEKGRNRKERANDKYYEGIRTTPYAPLVKACDRLANYSFAKEHSDHMAKCYAKEMDEFLCKITVETADQRYRIPEALLTALKNSN